MKRRVEDGVSLKKRVLLKQDGEKKNQTCTLTIESLSCQIKENECQNIRHVRNLVERGQSAKHHLVEKKLGTTTIK